MTPPTEITSAMNDYITQVLDTNDLLAEFMETAAERLTQGDNRHRVAHYLRETALTVRGSRERVQDNLRSLLTDTEEPEPTNALRGYLSRNVGTGLPRPALAGCLHVGHNSVDCQSSGLPVNEWCDPCAAKAKAG